MKARRVVDLIRGMQAAEAQALLRFAPQAASEPVGKVLDSAVANAEQTSDLDPDSLVVSEAYVDEGPTLKRFRPRAQGRAYRIRKRTSHITVESSSRGRRPRRRARKKGWTRQWARRSTRTGSAWASPPTTRVAVVRRPSKTGQRYSDYVKEDVAIRKLMTKGMERAGISQGRDRAHP